MIRVSAATRVQDVLNLRESWDGLLETSGGTVFQSWEWQRVWWKHYGRDKRPFILLVYEDEELMGIAPFFVSLSHLGLPFKVISFLGSGPSDYGDFLLHPSRRAEALEAIMGYLQTSEDWDVIDLQEIPSNSANLRALRELYGKGDFYPVIGGVGKIQEFTQDVSLALSLPGNWDGFLQSLDRKFRWNILYYARRLRRNHGVQVHRAGSVEEVDRGMSDLFLLHRRRQREKGLPTPILSRRYRGFHREVAHQFFRRGWLALYSLRVDEEVVSALYGFEHGDRFYYYLGGFDPSWGRLSVATILIAEVIEEAIERGFKTFDFLRGEESYKVRWGAVPRQNIRLVITRGRLRSSLLKAILERENVVIREVKQKLQKL
ncbi:MAG TPA: hypothetical protein DCW86_02680 [Actinobacteria bacterium]|nr:hypothetical protein [Actinomycetota bacterium]